MDYFKIIIDSLYKTDFYNALMYIQRLEKDSGETDQVLKLYYFYYLLLEWMIVHKNENNQLLQEVQNTKESYFQKIIKQAPNKSDAYLQLYLFLNSNFRTFDRYTWFGKYDYSNELLNLSLQENQNNLQAQFYLLRLQENIGECFEFLETNTLDTSLVERFLDDIWYKYDYIEHSYQLRKLYKLPNNEFMHHAQKKDFEWLYSYFNENQQEKYQKKFISFGKVCFELKKYDEAIAYFMDKKDISSDDYYVLGECYERKNEIQNAIESFKNHYINFQSGYWHLGIQKLFHHKAYDEINEVLQKDNSFGHKEYKKYFEAKLLALKKQYDESIALLNDLNSSHNQNDELQKDIYLMYICIYYNKTMKYLKVNYNRILEQKDFELSVGMGFLEYSHYDIYQDFEKYAKKLKIEFADAHNRDIDKYQNIIHSSYISLHKKLYKKAKALNIELSEDRKLYYLSAFDDCDALSERISIYKRRVEEEGENPKYLLELGKLHFKDKNFDDAKTMLNKAIELSQKYFMNLYGEPELLMAKVDGNTKDEKKQFFDKSIKNFIFHNSYQKDTTTVFFNQILYKYQPFSLNALSGLANNYLYFASPDKLNDPFDVASESLAKKFDNLELNKSDFKTCSLSKINNNKLMWSHYTNEHTGICVGYKFMYLPNYVGKEEVQYKNSNLQNKDIFQNIIDYWTVKSTDWEYEQEVRLLHYGDQEKIFFTFDIEQAIKDKKIALQIYSITLGLKFKEKELIKQTIKEIENRQQHKIEILQADIIGQKLEIKKAK